MTNYKLTRRELVALLRSRNLAALKGMTDDLAKQLIRELTDGMVKGQSNQDIIQRVDYVIADGLTRASTIASTETQYAFNQAALTRFEAWGASKVKILCGGAPCKTCSQYCGIEFALGEQPDIPAHPNCVCSIAPVSKYRR